MIKKILIKFYLDYLNDWLTVEAYANYQQLSVRHTIKLLDIGKAYHNESTD